MSQPIRRRTALAAGFALATPRLARAQATPWPTRPIRLILPYSAGGPTDIIARVLSEALSQRLPQRVVVENRTGAGGNIGASFVAKSAPDGGTFLFSNTGHAVNRSLYTHLDYDPATDLVPVSIIAESPMVMLVSNDLPVRDVAALVAMAKAQPGTLNYATSGSGGALQLVTLLFLQAAGLQMQEVPYRGSAPAAQDLVAGRLSLLYDASITSFPLAAAGQARALAVSSTRRSVVMPDVPTIGEAGYPDAVFSVWQAVLAPRGTPQPIVDAMQQAISAVLAESALRQRFIELGAETVLGNTPAEAQRYVAAEMDRWQAVLRRAGVQPQ